MLGMNRIEQCLEMITDNGAAALNLDHYGIAQGRPARCVVLQGQTPYEVLLGQSPVLASVRDGKLLVERAADNRQADLMLP